MAMILDAFVGICLEKLAVIVEEKATTVMGVKDELQKLQRKLGKIHMALEDAERRRLENAAINLWVLELKDILYDADDIIDLCLVKSPHLLSDGGDRLSSFSPTVCCHFLKFLCCFTSLSDRYAIGKGIQNLNERLKEIYEEKGIFDCVPKKPIIEKTLVNIGDTSPMLKFVVGRAIKEATKKLVEEMSFGFNEKKSYRVFAITGMSGIGKTTLAQRIFNNDKMKSYFQIKSWVCVSPTYSEIELLKQIIRDASGVYGDAKTKSELLPILGSALAGKSLFLVLDDVWRADVWIELLQNPIQMAGIEARILITTRDVNIAKLMRSFYIHPVTQLPDETGWEMLCRILFQEEQTEDMHRLREIGIKIVKKCHGLPLAIKAIAGVLSKREPNNKEWEEVLSRDAWSNSNLPEELRGPLYLSYDDLPSPLKQCFLYCSLWTEDWIIGREDLIRMWIAEGFIKVNGGDSTLMEDTGMDYYNELIRRNLLQLDPRFVDGSICSMHDMLRSLAEFLCEGERPRNFHGRNDKSSTKVRRMIISRPSELPNGQGDPTLQNRYLRTLICLDGAQFKGTSSLGRLECLRVLLINDVEIGSLPHNIGNLIHLRFLDLARTDIKELPKSIELLVNLQFLILSGCTALSALPQNITKLYNLRCLNLDDTPLIDFIPKGIGMLRQLNDLSGFVVGDDNIANPPEKQHSSLDEMNSLIKLRVLHVRKIELAQPRAVNLEKFSHLRELMLSCSPCSSQKTDEQIKQIEALFDEFKPTERLELLHISNYFGTQYPRWLMSSSLVTRFTYLTIVNLEGNESCLQLPPLGQLPNLKSLEITNAFAIKVIGQDFLVGGAGTSSHANKNTAFPKLELLKIKNLRDMEEWCASEEFKNGNESQQLLLWPCLNTLYLDNCNKLRSLPVGLKHAPLTMLKIRHAYSIKQVCHLSSLTGQLTLHCNRSLERVSDLPDLKYLIIEGSPNLKHVENLGSLQKIELHEDSMEFFLDWLPGLVQKKAAVDNDDNGLFVRLFCKEEKFRCCMQGGSYWSNMKQISRFEVTLLGKNGYIKYSKNPFSYNTNF